MSILQRRAGLSLNAHNAIKDWNSFCESTEIDNRDYVNGCIGLMSIQNSKEYPILLLPNFLNKQINKKVIYEEFSVIDIPCLFDNNWDSTTKATYPQENDATTVNSFFESEEEKLPLISNEQSNNTFTYNDFFNIAKDTGFIYDIPSPRKPIEPKKSDIPKGYYKNYKTINIPFIISYMIVSMIIFLIHMLIGYGLDLPLEERAIFSLVMLAFYLIVLAFYWEGFGFRKHHWITEKLKYIHYSSNEFIQKKAQLKAEFRQKLEKYERNLIAYSKEMELFLQKKNEQNSMMKDSFHEIVKIIWRQNMIGNNHYKQVETPPQRGRFENSLFYELMKIFPEYVKIDIEFLGRFPDIVINIENKHFIDIEIDEPYDLIEKKELHYIGCKDEERNDIFTENNWFVLRFAEEQLKSNLIDCVNIVKFLVDYIKNGNVKILPNIRLTQKEISIKRWTKEEARFMAINNYRI